MSKVVKNLLYLESHEWCKIEGKIATIGISDFAQHSLGTVVYVDSGSVGDKVTQGESFGAVESVKAASDINAPLSGEIIEVNEAVIDEPELLNADAYENWIIKIEISDESEIDALLDSSKYQELAK